MSANVELVRSIFAAWERGDYSSTEWAHPEIEYVIADGPVPGTWNGLAGLAPGFRGFLRAWAELRMNAESYRGLDGERILVFVRFSGRGKLSGLDIEQTRAQGAYLFHVVSGRVTRFV